MRVIITGASGVLGSAIFSAFTQSEEKYEVLGLAHSRPAKELQALGLTNKAEVTEVFTKFKPDCEHRCTWPIHENW